MFAFTLHNIHCTLLKALLYKQNIELRLGEIVSWNEYTVKPAYNVHPDPVNLKVVPVVDKWSLLRSHRIIKSSKNETLINMVIVVKQVVAIRRWSLTQV